MEVSLRIELRVIFPVKGIWPEHRLGSCTPLIGQSTLFHRAYLVEQFLFRFFSQGTWSSVS